MKLKNQAGQTVYFNPITKRGKFLFVIQAASGQVIRGRDKQKQRSRTFTQQHQAEAWLERNGYSTRD